jgi:hypothetical protein
MSQDTEVLSQDTEVLSQKNQDTPLPPLTLQNTSNNPLTFKFNSTRSLNESNPLLTFNSTTLNKSNYGPSKKNKQTNNQKKNTIQSSSQET